MPVLERKTAVVLAAVALMVVTAIYAAMVDEEYAPLWLLPLSVYGSYLIHRWWTARD